MNHLLRSIHETIDEYSALVSYASHADRLGIHQVPMEDTRILRRGKKLYQIVVSATKAFLFTEDTASNTLHFAANAPVYHFIHWQDKTLCSTWILNQEFMEMNKYQSLSLVHHGIFPSHRFPIIKGIPQSYDVILQKNNNCCVSHFKKDFCYFLTEPGSRGIYKIQQKNRRNSKVLMAKTERDFENAFPMPKNASQWRYEVVKKMVVNHCGILREEIPFSRGPVWSINYHEYDLLSKIPGMEQLTRETIKALKDRYICNILRDGLHNSSEIPYDEQDFIDAANEVKQHMQKCLDAFLIKKGFQQGTEPIPANFMPDVLPLRELFLIVWFMENSPFYQQDGIILTSGSDFIESLMQANGWMLLEEFLMEYTLLSRFAFHWEWFPEVWEIKQGKQWIENITDSMI